jgi:hypothetical protein
MICILYVLGKREKALVSAKPRSGFLRARERIKYVSTILKLKENYIADDDSYRQLHEMTTSLIYSKLPKETFTGPIKYVFKGDGQFQSSETTIGTYLSEK